MVRDIKNKPHGPKAAWLCKQNKQLPVTITSTLLSRFAKLGGRDPPHGGVKMKLLTKIYVLIWIIKTRSYFIQYSILTE